MTALRQQVDRAFVLAALRLPLLFALLFYGADALSAWRERRWRLYFEWELAIPYWPAAYPVYLSVFALPFVLPLCARHPRQVQCWEARMAACIVAATLVYALLPAQLGYAPADAGAWSAWARFTQGVAGRYNLLPSLHVALSLVTVRSLWPLVAHRLRATLLLWWLLLVASVLLTHQHHVLDVVAGIALALTTMALLRSDRGLAGGAAARHPSGRC